MQTGRFNVKEEIKNDIGLCSSAALMLTGAFTGCLDKERTSEAFLAYSMIARNLQLLFPERQWTDPEVREKVKQVFVTADHNKITPFLAEAALYFRMIAPEELEWDPTLNDLLSDFWHVQGFHVSREMNYFSSWASLYVLLPKPRPEIRPSRIEFHRDWIADALPYIGQDQGAFRQVLSTRCGLTLLGFPQEDISNEEWAVYRESLAWMRKAASAVPFVVHAARMAIIAHGGLTEETNGQLRLKS